jgi:hypothetical protein
MKTITQDTLIPLSLAAAILYSIFIVGSYANRVAANESNVEDLQKAMLDNNVDHKSILVKLGRIEGLLETRYRLEKK